MNSLMKNKIDIGGKIKMTHDEIQRKIGYILEKLNKEEYPELYDVMLQYANYEDVDEWMYELTTDIYDADQTKKFPVCVSEFLISIYNYLIEQQNYDVACDMGSLYYKGRFGKIDYKKAVEYYTLAADNGCRQAQENLGYCYYYGRDVEIDYKKAFHYFSLGAFDGHINSLYKIGDMYRNGYYVDKNPIEAFRIYKRCLETLTEEAIPLVGADVMLRMGDSYFEGIGVEIDWNEAYHFYRNAEVMYYERLMNGDFMIRKCYEKSIHRQSQIKDKRNAELPTNELG